MFWIEFWIESFLGPIQWKKWFFKTYRPGLLTAQNSSSPKFIFCHWPKPISKYSTNCFFVVDDVNLKFEEVDWVKAGNVWVRCVFGNAFLGKDPATKLDEFLEKFQTAFDPPLIFGRLCCKFFYNGYGSIYARRYEGQIVWNACTCLL